MDRGSGSEGGSSAAAGEKEGGEQEGARGGFRDGGDGEMEFGVGRAEAAGGTGAVLSGEGGEAEPIAVPGEEIQ